MPSSCPVDEPQVGISISEGFQKMRVDSTTVHERYVQYVTRSAKTIGNSHIGLGNQNFFATGHVQCFLGKAWSTMPAKRRADAGGVGSIRRP